MALCDKNTGYKMGDLSKNFSRYEFACQCGCGLDDINPELVDVLQQLRDRFNQPVLINSACRCHEHNEFVQKQANPNYIPGSSRSQHLLGTAADIRIRNTSPERVQRYAKNKYKSRYGIGSYNTFTHIDVKSGPARRW